MAFWTKKQQTDKKKKEKTLEMEYHINQLYEKEKEWQKKLEEAEERHKKELQEVKKQIAPTREFFWATTMPLVVFAGTTTAIGFSIGDAPYRAMLEGLRHMDLLGQVLPMAFMLTPIFVSIAYELSHSKDKEDSKKKSDAWAIAHTISLLACITSGITIAVTHIDLPVFSQMFSALSGEIALLGELGTFTHAVGALLPIIQLVIIGATIIHSSYAIYHNFYKQHSIEENKAPDGRS